MTTTTSTYEPIDLVYWLYPGGIGTPEVLPEITFTGPVDGVWTITAPDSVSQEELDAAVALQWQSIQSQMNYEALVAKMPTALSANSTYLSIESPTNEQIQAQIEALTRQTNLLLRIRLGDYNDISDT